MSVIGVLQLVFIVLKLTDNISWTWKQTFIPTFVAIGYIIFISVIRMFKGWMDE